MVCLWIEVDGGTAAALGRLFERFGCRVVERTSHHLRIGFPEASSEGEAVAEAQLYLSMRPTLRGAFRLAAATRAS